MMPQLCLWCGLVLLVIEEHSPLNDIRVCECVQSLLTSCSHRCDEVRSAVMVHRTKIQADTDEQSRLAGEASAVVDCCHDTVNSSLAGRADAMCRFLQQGLLEDMPTGTLLTTVLGVSLCRFLLWAACRFPHLVLGVQFWNLAIPPAS